MNLPLKQINDTTCMQTCLAMIVGESVEYVVDWLQNDRELTGQDAIIFLAHHGVYCAIYGEPEEKGEYLDLEKDEELFIRVPTKGYPALLTKDEELFIRVPTKGYPALLTVESERFDGYHSVLWTGKKVLDPSSESESERLIESYKITEFWPLLLTEERAKQILEM